MKTYLRFNLQRFSEGGDDPTITVEQFNELQENYKRLEKQFTKVTQEKSTLEQQFEALKPWGDFDAWVRSNPEAAKEIESVVNKHAQGGNVTQTDLNKVSSAINKAEKQGDDETVKRLEALESQLAEAQIEKTFTELEKRANAEGLEGFSIGGFHEFATKYLEEEEGIGEDDEVTPKDLRRAYTAYEAHLLKENKKREKIPALNSGSSSGVSSNKGDNKQPRGLKARIAAVRAREGL